MARYLRRGATMCSTPNRFSLPSSSMMAIPKDTKEDFPTPGPLVTTVDGSMTLPAIIYGAGTLSKNYNSDDYLASDLPVRSLRLAFRYGIRVIDTSVYYGSSEIMLGNILQSLQDDFPRSSYQLMTKCGRYGLADFDYSPVKIRKTVVQSLERLKTNYLDTVFLHDVEFVGTPVTPTTFGNHVSSLKEDAALYGLAFGDEARVRGKGDQKILDAYRELQALQREGLVKKIGITGYPLPTLLRLAILILNNPPYKAVDTLLSYSHLCLQNSTFLEFVPHFYERAKVGQLIAASPLSMGLLTPNPPPWHPAPPKLRQAVVDASRPWAGDFTNLATGFSLRHTTIVKIPLVIGFSTPREVHEAVKVWRNIVAESADEERKKGEMVAQNVIRNAGYLDWSWASP